MAAAAAPQRKPSQGRGADWWNEETADAVRQARQAERAYAARRAEANWKVLHQARQQQKKVIRKAQRNSWRKAVDKATKEDRHLWALAKWAQERSHLPATTAALPDL